MCSTYAPPRTSLAVGKHHARSAHHVPIGTHRSKKSLLSADKRDFFVGPPEGIRILALRRSVIRGSERPPDVHSVPLLRSHPFGTVHFKNSLGTQRCPMNLARPKGFEPPIFRIGICCVIQLRHGRKYSTVMNLAECYSTTSLRHSQERKVDYLKYIYTWHLIMPL